MMKTQKHSTSATLKRRVWVPIMATVPLLASCSSTGGSKASLSGGSNGTTAKAAQTVPIGATFDLTGSYAQYGVYANDAVSMAVQQINKTGFIVNGTTYKFKLYSDDSQSTISTGVSQIRSLIGDDHVVALFGPQVSVIGTPASAITTAAKVIEFSPPTSIQAEVDTKSSQYPYLIASQSPYGPPYGSIYTLGKDVVSKYGIKTVALLNPNDAAGTVYTPFFVQGVEAAGGKVVYNQYFPPATTDFSPYIRAIAAAKPQGLFFGYTNASMIPIMTAARQVNAAQYYIGGPGTNQIPAQQSGSTTESNYIWSSAVLSTITPTPPVAQFFSSLASFTHTAITPAMSNAFDQYSFPFVLVKAMQAAGTTTDTTKIIEQLKGHSFSLPGQPISSLVIDARGQAWTPYQICDLLKGPQCTTITPDVPPTYNGS